MAKSERPPIKWLFEGALSRKKARVYRQVALELGIPYRTIPPRKISDPSRMPRHGEVRVEILYGDRHAEFNRRALELSPPPKPYKPKLSVPRFDPSY